MTLNDIKKEVAVLGFESESAVDGSIENAARRALATVYTDHGVYSSGRIYQHSPIPCTYIPKIIHTGTEDDVISLCSASYAFLLTGNGYFSVTDRDGERIQEFDTPSSYVCGRVNGEGSIRFKGEFRYTVYDLCIYNERFPDGVKPPRYGKAREYRLDEFMPDFLFPASIPTDGSGQEIAGAVISTGVLHIPYFYSGEINLKYRKRAPEVSINNPDNELGVPKELEHLVSLLTAAYVWLDDDADKAQYYMSLYRDGTSSVKLYARGGVDTAFRDTTRWA